MTEGKHCDICDEVFVKQNVIDALGHTEVIDKAVSPTCTETGLTEGKHCSVCNDVLVEQTVVNALGHTEVIDKAIAPTCTEPGLTESKHCAVCYKELIKPEVIPANGHHYVNYTCTACGDKIQATPDEYFIFKELANGTYSIKVKNSENLPADVIIPSTYNGKAVTRIAEKGFYACRSLKSVTIPDSITNINAEAFSSCMYLTSVIMPDSVTSIGPSAFSSCHYLTNIYISNKVTYIHENTFKHCSSLTSLVIPDSVTYIECGALYGCISLQELTIPFTGRTAKKSEIECRNFFGWIFGYKTYETTTNNFKLKNNVQYSEWRKNSSGQWCYLVYEYNIPDSLSKVTVTGNAHEYAFTNCKYLTCLSFSGNTTSIPAYDFFGGCQYLGTIVIGSKVTAVDGGIFAKSNRQMNIIVESGNTNYHSQNGCLIETEAKKLICGNKYSTIPDDGSVTVIGESAFEGSYLEILDIPECITKIENSAFADCHYLYKINYYAKNCSVNSTTFSNGNRVFYNAGSECSGITLTIGKNVERLHVCLFEPTYPISSHGPNVKTVIFEYGRETEVLGFSAFNYMSNVKTVYYWGTKDDWDKIYRDYLFSSAVIHYRSST